jgi:hypothetical protein
VKITVLHRARDRGLRVLVACATVLLLAGATQRVALANGPEIGMDAGGVFPLESSDIALESEFVTVHLGGYWTTHVECQYTLRNLTDDHQTITMDFVTNTDWKSGVSEGPFTERTGFQVLVVARERRAVPVRMVGVDKSRWRGVLPSPPDSLPAWDVSFRPRGKVTLQISYDASWSGGCGGPDCTYWMRYIAKPARLWAGSIGHASITFEFDPLTRVLMRCNPDFIECLKLSAKPEGFVQSPRGFTWKLRDWEPDENFEVRAEWSEVPR